MHRDIVIACTLLSYIQLKNYLSEKIRYKIQNTYPHEIFCESVLD